MASVFYCVAKIYEAKAKATISASMRIAAKYHGPQDDENVKHLTEAYLASERE